jgi:hypothetical protein
LLASQKNHPLAASTSLGSANLLLLPDDRDRHDDDELDADRLRPTGGSAPSDLKLLPDELDVADRRPEPPPPPFLPSLLQNTGNAEESTYTPPVSSSSSKCPAARYLTTAGRGVSRKAVGRWCGWRRDGDTDDERADE